MDITKHIVDDHDEIRTLSKRANESEEDFMSFSRMVKTHAKAEEKSLYESLKKMDEFHDKMTENFEDHEKVESLLMEMERISVEDKEWTKKMETTIDALDRHMREEENDLFPRIKDALTEERLEEIGEVYLLQKEEISPVIGPSGKVQREEKSRDIIA
jgi:hemerythrin superfamily protein